MNYAAALSHKYRQSERLKFKERGKKINNRCGPQRQGPQRHAAVCGIFFEVWTAVPGSPASRRFCARWGGGALGCVFRVGLEQMKTLKMMGVLLFGALVITPGLAAQKKPNDTSTSKLISASGYVTTGVEAGCLMLQDSKTKTLYNLFFTEKKKPALGEAIQFTGKRHDGPTTCMQGEAVNVQKWSPLKPKP